MVGCLPTDIKNKLKTARAQFDCHRVKVGVVAGAHAKPIPQVRHIMQDLLSKTSALTVVFQ